MLEDAVDLVVDLGGTLAGEHGEGRLRAPSLERAWGPAWTRAFRTTEDLPDPNGLSNPAPYPAGARG